MVIEPRIRASGEGPGYLLQDPQSCEDPFQSSEGISGSLGPGASKTVEREGTDGAPRNVPRDGSRFGRSTTENPQGQKRKEDVGNKKERVQERTSIF